MKTKHRTTLVAFVILVSAANTASAQHTDSLDMDLRGHDGDFSIDLRHSDGVELRSYGDANTLDLRAHNNRDMTLWMLGDGVTGAVRSQGSEGLSVVMGMCPEGMQNETIRANRDTDGLVIPRCVH